MSLEEIALTEQNAALAFTEKKRGLLEADANERRAAHRTLTLAYGGKQAPCEFTVGADCPPLPRAAQMMTGLRKADTPSKASPTRKTRNDKKNA